MKQLLILKTLILLGVATSLWGQSPIPQEEGASYIFAPGTIAIPSITPEQILNRFNEFEFKGKYKRKDLYFTMIITIEKTGRPTYFEVNTCETFPYCDKFLKDKKLLWHFYNSITEDVIWRPGIYKGEVVNSRGQIRCRLINGLIEEVIIE